MVAADLLLRALELSDLMSFEPVLPDFPVPSLFHKCLCKSGGRGWWWWGVLIEKGPMGVGVTVLESLVYPATLSGMLEV